MRLDTQVKFPNINFVDGFLYLMDGQLSGPLCLGKTTEESFLNDCVPHIKGYFERNVGNPKFGITVLAKTPTTD